MDVSSDCIGFLFPDLRLPSFHGKGAGIKWLQQPNARASQGQTLAKDTI